MTTHKQDRNFYVQEAGELLQQMNTSLLLLEKERHNGAALDEIFRSAHTLKSMAASMGYAPVSKLAHKMEELLSRLRSGASEAGAQIVEILFKSFDALARMSRAVQEDKEIKEDVAPLIAALDSYIGTARVPYIKTEGAAPLGPEEKRALLRARKAGWQCFNVEIELSKDCGLKGARAAVVLRNLSEIGEVIKTWPSARSIEQEEFDIGFSCVLATAKPGREVEKIISGLPDVSKAAAQELAIPGSWAEEADAESADAAPQPGAAGTTGPARADEGQRKIQSVRVDVKRLDILMNLAEELTLNQLRLAAAARGSEDIVLKAAIERFSRLTAELQAEVMQARLVPVGQIFNRFQRIVRDLAKKEGKLVRLEISGGEIELDRTVLDEIWAPLIHILRNAVAHGIENPQERRAAGKNEEGRVTLSARRDKSRIFIEAEDDGRGMDTGAIKKAALKRGLAAGEALDGMTEPELLLLTTRPGFSTTEGVTEVSGRGVGLDAAKQKTESLGGGLFIDSSPGKGTRISLQLPVTTAVVQALLVGSRAGTFALSLSSIIEITVVNPDRINTMEGKEIIFHRDKVIPIVRLDQVLYGAAGAPGAQEAGRRPKTEGGPLNIVIVESGKAEYGVVVEELIGQHNIVIKQLAKELRGLRGFAGATILGDGNVALVLDAATLI